MSAVQRLAKSKPKSPKPVQRSASESSSSTGGFADADVSGFYSAEPVLSLNSPVQLQVIEEDEQENDEAVVQHKCATCEAEEKNEADEPVQFWDCSEYQEPTCVQNQLDSSEALIQEKCAACEAEEEVEEDEKEVQQEGSEARDPRIIQRDARKGLANASLSLPHSKQIQESFGHHDVSHVRTSIGGAARSANQRMGALAFTSGDRIGFRESPSLHLAAHEAAHVIQQREGLNLPGNVGRAGDRWEQHADRVADAVVGGRSAEPVLDEVAVPSAPSNKVAESDGNLAESASAVQQQITSGTSRLFEPETVTAETPGETEERNQEIPETGSREAESTERGEEGSAIEAAAEGERDAQPEGIPVEGQIPAGGGRATSAAGAPASPASASTSAAQASIAETSTAAAESRTSTEPATPAAGAPMPTTGPEISAQGATAETPSGGGINAPCYNIDPPPPPDNAREPTSDERGSEPEEQPQVTFEPWPAEADECPAEDTVAEASTQMPEGLGTGEVTTSGAHAAGGISTAAIPEGESNTRTTSLEDAAPSGSSEVQQMARSATTSAEQVISSTSDMEGQIANAEGERNTAVNDYLASTSLLPSVLARARSLESGVTFPAAEDAQQFEARQSAISQVRDFMASAADQIAAAVDFAQEQMPDMLRAAAESANASIQDAIETEKTAISDRIAQARAQARAGAATARAQIHAEYANSASMIETVTVDALAVLDTTYTASIDLVDDKETDGLDDVNSRFAAGREQHESKGPVYADRAIARGQEHAAAYEHCKGDYRDDGFWDGCLTVRRAKAQQDTACKTAAGYKDTFLQTANKKGYDLIALRRQYRCAVIAGARRVNQTIDDTYDQLVSGLESGRMQALEGIALARDENLAAVDNALAATLRSLSAQEYSQRQAVNDTGYLKQVAVEQLAHAGAAGLVRGISVAMDSLEQTLLTLRESFAQGDIPDPMILAQSLATTEAALGGGMGTLLDTMMNGSQQSGESITGLGDAALEALAMLTAKNDELSVQAESGFAQQMSNLTAGASAIFSQLTGNHVQQAQQAMTEGVSSIEQAVAGFDDALGTIGGRIDEAIATSLDELDQQLNTKLGELDGQIAREAWKAAEKEQPAWKSVVAIILVIVVIIAAAVISIVTLGAGASLFAVILVGALVGAVSGGLIQLINNWASGEAWHTGLVQAMVMGAIGGAIGGGLGFAGGALSAGAAAAGARAATQFAITLGADLASEALTQTAGYFLFGQEFNWQGFVMAGAMSGVSFRAQPSGANAAVARAAGGAGARRAAVTQIAGGAALGLGLEAGTAYLSGQEFDLTRAASSAASAAVSARMSRRAAPAGPSPEPTTRLGRAAESLRAFDPGGVGARLETRLQGLGGQAFGPRRRRLMTGSGTTSEVDLVAGRLYDEIRNDTNDVRTIADELGVPVSAVERIKNHLFIAEHDIPTPSGIVRERFEPVREFAEMWQAAQRGALGPEQSSYLRDLLTHENVEAILHARGTPVYDPNVKFDIEGYPQHTFADPGAHSKAVVAERGFSAREVGQMTPEQRSTMLRPMMEASIEARGYAPYSPAEISNMHPDARAIYEQLIAERITTTSE